MAYRKISRTRTADINITNLVDVIFALLIIFMISAPLMSQGIKVDLPKVNTKNIEMREAIRVSITKKRVIYINEQKVSLYNFEREFNSYFVSAETPVIVNADRMVPYGFVIEIINKLREAGVEKLGFLTETPLTAKNP